MIIACLDTSTSIASFKLLKDGVVLAELQEECRRGASKLLPEINDAVKKVGLKVSDVETWLVGIGPGSFTGIRVGISYIKGICLASKNVYIGVNSGFAYFDAKSVKENKIQVLHDGRKNELILNTFEKKSDKWSSLEPKVIHMDDLHSYLSQEVFTVTIMDPTCFKEENHQEINFIDAVNATGLMAINLEKMESLSTNEMENSCEPIYVRPPVFVQPVLNNSKK
jgi:tRNA threonylcarbamoyl adenosine modification protein YeaZ